MVFHHGDKFEGKSAFSVASAKRNKYGCVRYLCRNGHYNAPMSQALTHIAYRKRHSTIRAQGPLLFLFSLLAALVQSSIFVGFTHTFSLTICMIHSPIIKEIPMPPTYLLPLIIDKRSLFMTIQQYKLANTKTRNEI